MTKGIGAWVGKIWLAIVGGHAFVTGTKGVY
jgi:hypothetical protein